MTLFVVENLSRAVSWAVGGLGGDASPHQSAPELLEASGGLDSVGERLIRPQLLGHGTSPGVNSGDNVARVNVLRPHGRLASQHQLLLLRRAVELVRVAVVQLFPVATGLQVVQVPARRQQGDVPGCGHLRVHKSGFLLNVLLSFASKYYWYIIFV